MYLVIFSISIALALPLVNCENTLSELNITASEADCKRYLKENPLIHWTHIVNYFSDSPEYKHLYRSTFSFLYLYPRCCFTGIVITHKIEYNNEPSAIMAPDQSESCFPQLERKAAEHCSKHKKFLVGAPSVSWFQAHINCGLFGYKLATITSKEENENILKQLKVQGLKAPVVWIGLNDLAHEGEFVWAGNVRLNSSEYLNWYVTEPNNANDYEDCVNLNPDGTFNDFFCTSNLQYVCEYFEAIRCVDA